MPIWGAVGGAALQGLGGFFGSKAKAGAPTNIDTINKIISIGDKDGKPGIHIASLPCPTVSDKGLTKGWLALDLIAKGAAALATARSMQAAKRQNKIARQYYELAKRQWDFYERNYIPLELQEIAEINRVDKHKPDYNTTRAGHDCANDIFDSMQEHRDRLFREYCICPDDNINHTLELALSTVRGDSHNFSMRYAEFHADMLDDIRWNRKMQIAARGRGILPQSAEFANKSAGLFGQYSQAMSGFASQAARFSGYIRNRSETEYNGSHSPVPNRLNDRRTNTLLNTEYGPADISSLDGYNSGYYNGGSRGFYTDAIGSSGTGSIFYDNIHSVQEGFGVGSITGNLA